MIKEPAFVVELQGYSVHRLLHEDIGAIQVLYEKCLDYMLLVDGHPAGENAAEEEFQDMPPGKSLDDKCLCGIVGPQNELVGLLDAVRWYPDETTWWIGLLLLVPDVRSQGIGKKVLEGFVKYVEANGGKAVMLGVVEENERAYLFWSRMGFEFIRRTEPRQFGNKTQTVSVMRRAVQDL